MSWIQGNFSGGALTIETKKLQNYIEHLESLAPHDPPPPLTHLDWLEVDCVVMYNHSGPLVGGRVVGGLLSYSG